jgi:HTH-type transcriptional regulator/antitoxin HipB
MKRRFLATVEAVGQAVRDGRKEKGLTQAQLATRAGVGRRFVVEVESGHMRAELGKVLSILEALDIHAVALPSIPTEQRLKDVDLDEVMKRFE